VVGIDNLNDYYSIALKKARLRELASAPGQGTFHFEACDVGDGASLSRYFQQHGIVDVIHLAAQAGVRYSIENPHAYQKANLEGFLNILECCRHAQVRHLVYASSSSVYGMNRKMPFSVSDNVDHPVSLYAATKKANELMAHTYSHLYGIPSTGLRFFTVYGPWGRPDMACFLFTRAILEGEPIRVFNEGRMQRDFTYIDDIVEGVLACLDKPPAPNENDDQHDGDPATSSAPYRVFNIGNHQPVALLDFIAEIESALGKKAIMDFQAMQPGDVPATYADIDALRAWTGYAPRTPLSVGIPRFVQWYTAYRNTELEQQQ
jgi:UDP-glucuronate 4-epimerase